MRMGLQVGLPHARSGVLGELMILKRKSTPVDLDGLTLDELNANRGTVGGRELLSSSLKPYGAGRSVLADRDGEVIAGNKTVEQARALKLPIRLVHTDGRTLVVVQKCRVRQGS